MALAREAAALLLVFCLAPRAEGAPGVDDVRRKLRPSVPALAKRLVEYGKQGDLGRLRKMKPILEPLLRALDAEWGTDLETELERSLAAGDAKRAALVGLRLLYWDLRDLLEPARARAEIKPKTLHTRILKAREDYEVLAPLVRVRKDGRRLHLGIMKGFQSLVRSVPFGNAYGTSRHWRIKASSAAGIILKLIKAALPRLHGKDKDR